MAARKRREGESFAKYRENLKAEQKAEDYRLSNAYNFTRHSSRIIRKLAKTFKTLRVLFSRRTPKAILRKTTKAQRVARRYNRASR